MISGNDGGSNTYSNQESRNRDFVTFSLMPWASTVEDVLSSLLPEGTWLEVDFAGLLRPDSATRFATNVSAAGGPLETVNEVRAEENLPPLPEPERTCAGGAGAGTGARGGADVGLHDIEVGALQYRDAKVEDVDLARASCTSRPRPTTTTNIGGGMMRRSSAARSGGRATSRTG